MAAKKYQVKLNSIHLDLQSGTSYTVFATWAWSESNTENYQVFWEYDSGDGVWFVGNDSTTQYKQSTYSVPSNAFRVRFRVKPIAKKEKKGNTEKPYWNGIFSSATLIEIPQSGESMPAPSTPRVEIAGRTLKIVLDNISLTDGPTHVRFDIVKNNKVKSDKVYDAKISTRQASYSYSVEAGAEYKVRARCIRKITSGPFKGINVYSPWSDYSDNVSAPLISPPETPSISVNGQKLTMSVNVYNEPKAKKVRFHLVQDNTTDVTIGGKTTVDVTIKKNYAEYTLTVPYGHVYKAQAKLLGDDQQSTYSEYSENSPVTQEAMSTPSAPSVEIKNLRLTASVSVYDDKNPTYAIFEIIQNNKTSFKKSGKINIVTNFVSFSWDVTPGSEYKVHVMYGNSKQASDWSQYSSSVSTGPANITGSITAKAESDTSVRLTWTKATSATSYEVQYTDTKDYFDKSPDNVQSMTVEGVTTAIVTGLDTGKVWYFRVRATNEQGSSGWTSIASCRIGMKPTAPTTWSYTSTVSIGQDAVLNWVHNCEDGSDQTSAQVRLTINGTANTFNVSGKTSVYRIKTGAYKDGTIIYWEVRTKGAMTADSYFSPWSTKRQITIYSPVTVNVSLFTENNWRWDPFEFAVDTIYTAKGDGLTPLTDGLVRHLPIYISATAYPSTQKLISFALSIVATEAYDTLDDYGLPAHVQKGTEVYKKFFTGLTTNGISVALTAGDVILESNMTYTVKAVAAMSSGLSGEGTADFTIAWQSDDIEPSAEITVDTNTMSAYIHPFCDNGYADALLSVYRREYDGTLTPIAVNIDANEDTTVVDPHPSLDFARYRITALSKINGLISFTDMPGEEVGCTSIVIQWDEEWAPFDYTGLGLFSEPPYSGSMLVLPYNIDVQNNVNRDVSLVNYIGRSNPVSYYGTQRGETASWSSDIPATDVETLYQIRRLAQYAGDVYVREPSGIGYWANVTVNYKIEHTKTIVPVTLDIKRVDGGM